MGAAEKGLFTDMFELMLIRMNNNYPSCLSLCFKVYLSKGDLRVCRPRKRQFLKRNNLITRLKYTPKLLIESFWHSVLWFDETKNALFDHSNKTTVRKQTGETYNPKKKPSLQSNMAEAT